MDPTILCGVFLPMLNHERFQITHSRINIGKAIYHTYNGSREGCILWMHYSNSLDDKEYYTFHDDKITVKTIAYYARVDSLDMYQKWIYDRSKQIIQHNFNEEQVILDIYYLINWLNLIFSEEKWYLFQNNRWRHDTGNIHVRKSLDNVIQILSRVEDDISFHHGLNITRMIKNLKNALYKKDIILRMKSIFQDDNFLELLDANLYIMGFNNGVTEIIDKDIFFREGIPEDYVATTCGLDYIENEYNWKDCIPLLNSIKRTGIYIPY